MPSTILIDPIDEPGETTGGGTGTGGGSTGTGGTGGSTGTTGGRGGPSRSGPS